MSSLRVRYDGERVKGKTLMQLLQRNSNVGVGGKMIASRDSMVAVSGEGGKEERKKKRVTPV